MKNKEKYLSIIFISTIIIFFILIIIGAITIINNKKNEPNEEQNNNIVEEKENEKENENGNEVIKVIVDENDDKDEKSKGNENKEKDKDKEAEKPNLKNENKKEEENLNAKNAYYIKINNQANTVTIYKKDEQGKYTIPIKAMICSIGNATPKKGVFKISDKYDWRLLQGNVYGQYAVRITGHILFHSVPYTKKSKDSLEWWEYDKLGTKASLGCIRLTVEDSKWIHDNCEKGTQVEFYSDENPGPLGKPTAKKISEYSEELKKWDPTDPDSKNPWKTYNEPEKEENKTQEIENENNTISKPTNQINEENSLIKET